MAPGKPHLLSPYLLPSVTVFGRRGWTVSTSTSAGTKRRHDSFLFARLCIFIFGGNKLPIAKGVAQISHSTILDAPLVLPRQLVPQMALAWGDRDSQTRTDLLRGRAEIEKHERQREVGAAHSSSPHSSAVLGAVRYGAVWCSAATLVHCTAQILNKNISSVGSG